MPLALLALGGNRGDIAATMDSTLRELSAHPRVTLTARSRLYRTRAVGSQAGDDFLNAAATIETALPPLELLDLLQLLEARHGRTREIHWGPRPLDLDLILYGDEIINHPRLRVPHPAGWYRRFVLDPACEIASDLIHPEKHVPLADLRSRLLPRPLTMRFAGGSETEREELIAALSQRTTSEQMHFDTWTPEERAGPTFLVWLGPDSDQQFTAEELPELPRLDVPENPTARVEFLGYVLDAALGEPVPEP